MLMTEEDESRTAYWRYSGGGDHGGSRTRTVHRSNSGVRRATLKPEPQHGKQIWSQGWEHKAARQVVLMIGADIVVSKMRSFRGSKTRPAARPVNW